VSVLLEAGTAYPSRAHGFTPVVVGTVFLHCVVFCVSSSCLCLVYPMLPVSLDCPFWLALRFSLTF